MLSDKSDAGLEVASLPEADETTHEGPTDEDRDAQPSSVTSGQTKCSICQSTFRRPEHLKRHFRSHTKEKPFECAQCGRHFSRTDTLHRHELSHHTLGTEGGKDRTHRITVKTFRACFKCAVARVRCSGGTPCVRCENRALDCQYPTERRSKVKARKDVSSDGMLNNGNISPIHASNVMSSMTEEDVSRSRTESNPSYRPPEYQVGQFQLQLSSMNGPNTSSNVTTERNSYNFSRMQQDDLQNARRPSQAESLGLASEPADSRRFSLQSYPGLELQRAYPQLPISEDRSTLSDGHRLPPGTHMSSFQPGGTSSTPHVDISTGGTGSQAPLGLASSFLDQSMFSTINWLPNDLLLDAANERPVASRLSSHSFQSAVLDSPWGRTPWLPPVINMGNSPTLPENVSQSPAGNVPLGSDMPGPEKFRQDVSHSSSLSASISSTPSNLESNATKRSADHYIDSDGARLPKYRRRQNSWHEQSAELADIISRLRHTDDAMEFSFPAIEQTEIIPPGEHVANFQIDASTYDTIHKSFTELCCSENILYPKFGSQGFPASNALSSFIHLYFNSFHPVYPILHPATFDPNKCHWLVILAVSAIGCHIADFTGQGESSAAFHEFLRRAINVEKEKSCADQIPLWLIQASTLNHIGLLHGNNERTRRNALSSFGSLVDLATKEGLLCSTQSELFSSGDPVERQWTLWVEDELKRRTGYLIWLLDCTLTYHFDARPLLSLDDGLAPLPSHENLWQAKSAGAWKQLHDKALGRGNFSLYDAVVIMYIEKRLVPSMADFSHILLVHALYHRMWEVGDYFRRPLSFWNPTAKKQSREAAIPTGSVWLPGIPSYSKWRNSACDCLDILHWTANSTIAKAAGLEHPTVLHLHEARIVLLAPFHEIRSLATSLATGKIAWSERQQAIEWHYIQRWIKHDQYKARLAIIHAGTSLWHIQRYSTNAFHEPVAAFLAILTLWAYGLCHPQASPGATGPYAGSMRRPSQEPSFVHLDRPCDDELVQMFVREGQVMRANITGVGDICSPHGPERILRAGCTILAGINSWGISRTFIVTLAKLAEVMAPQARP
ncbi:C2H2 type zinc finger domain protein [Aspergillus steynii IBT 23096]|uniref:C2H2 type zinc finger domain protein n=1 Tax=Aspergillus steynii IBT 23096 TaxID=1392250 RepID=A0A2I2G351_9EURO|nr:C2H2 type zinc finger domain protein [Aspergillus steynii IBT 23096]PLB47304.1 C2H2 type zinc finger domain protein [Aspergillus steynii IBT 23096]